MRTLAEDLTPEMEAVQISLWRRQTPANKLMRLMGLWQLARQLIRAGIRSQNQTASESEIYRQLYVRRLGRKRAEQVFATGKWAFMIAQPRPG